LKISFIIPTFDSSRFLENHLSILKNLCSKYNIEPEIIVIDTGSKDSTIDIAKKLTDKVIDAAGVTRGHARNQGAKLASGQLLAFIDSDCEVTEKWIRRVSNLPTNLDSIALGGPVILDPQQSLIGKAIRDLLLNPVFTLKSASFSIIRKGEVKEIPTANLIVPKIFFDRIGGFPDVDFNEDTLFSRRVLQLNGTISYDLQLEVIHKHHFESIKSFSLYFFRYGSKYAKTLTENPSFVRRYALVAFALPIILILFIGLTVAFGLPQIMLLFILGCFAGTLIYSFVKTKRWYAFLFPFLFVVLSSSYLCGFYRGLIKS
jgi:glycosyltransferase involved in cell wall biosynthesis